MPFTHESAARYGAKGGRKRSVAKKAHARANGAKGGRPLKLPPEPEGFRLLRPVSADNPLARFEELRKHGLQFIEYSAQLIVKKNFGNVWPFTEEEILDTLRRMKRYDLVSRRKKQIEEWTKKKSLLSSAKTPARNR
jgi:hypothetical protein